MTTPVLILVGADKGGVGKTTVARLILSWLDKHKIACRIVDTEDEPTSLRRFYAKAEHINVAKVAGQMRVFDNLARANVTLIDIRAGLLSNALRAMQDAGFFADVASGAIRLVVVHVVDANVASLEEMAPTAARVASGGHYFIVKNQVGEEHFGADDATLYRRYFDGIGAKAMIDVSHLDDMAAKAVDREGVPFDVFAANMAPPETGRSSWLMKIVKAWLDRGYAQFDDESIGLGKALRG